MSGSWVLCLTHFLLILFTIISSNKNPSRFAHGVLQNGSSSSSSTTTMRRNTTMVPLIKPGMVEKMVLMNESRRKLGSFRICALCTCCGGPKGLCLPSPCCYAINCNIPNRPFGFCSFTPKTCNCFGCHI